MPIPQPPLAPTLKVPLPMIARGIVKASLTGWTRVAYYDPITDATVVFAEPPSVVALTESTTGRIESVKVEIPAEIPDVSVSIPADIPEVAVSIPAPISAVPVAIPLTVPETSILAAPVTYIKFSSTNPIIQREICDPLNTVTQQLGETQNKLNQTIAAVNSGFAKTNQSIKDLRTKTENAINQGLGGSNNSVKDLRTKTENAINQGLGGSNSALKDLRTKTETATNRGFAKTNDSIKDLRTKTEKALNEIIPTLYAMIGLPLNHKISLVEIRPPRNDCFEFYSLYPNMIVHYVAIGKRATP